MDIKNLKLDLVKQILETDKVEILDQVYSILKNIDYDFWSELTDDQKNEILISRKQIENGETEQWSNLYSRIK